jgi:hypothetical protein
MFGKPGLTEEFRMTHPAHILMTAKARGLERDLLDHLARRGFKRDFGDQIAERVGPIWGFGEDDALVSSTPDEDKIHGAPWRLVLQLRR